jgi:phosphatidylglycerol:prolipoprotein diacylglycerol transferase
VTFPEIARRMHPGLPGVPIHPTQIYMSLNALLILGILVLLYRNKRFHGRIISVYVLLYATTRFFIELVRGDADRGFVFGSQLSTSQFLGLLLAILAGMTYLALDRRHRQLHEPDWRPAC